MKISILLPYKENFSENYAGAVSIFINDTLKKSKFKKKITIYGNTKFKNFLNKNYLNLTYKNYIFRSTSKSYISEFLKKESIKKSHLIEFHNRPIYLKYLFKLSYAKKVLYFHNDPLEMSGSKTKKERVFLIKNLEKIVFNSEWSKNQFIKGLNVVHQNSNKLIVIKQSIEQKKNINLNLKEKSIIFVGKLNRAKGYDLFGKAVTKILDKYPKWKAIVIGDEPREKINFSHPRLNILGFKKHKTVLRYLEKSSISVVCSRWNEPFGRSSLEAASRGCAVIISNRGGLKETITHGIILKKLSSQNLEKKIEKLIIDPSLRKKYQRNSLKNFYLTNNYITKKIDNYRKNLLLENIKLNNLKILHITNLNERHKGRLFYNTSRRITNGLIKLNHKILTISDRDVLSYNRSLNDIDGSKKLNKMFLDTTRNFKPDLILLGHADLIKKESLLKIKIDFPNIKIGQWFLDRMDGKWIKNKSRFLDKIDLMDHSFCTTDPKTLNFNSKYQISYIPNPVDPALDDIKVYENRSAENDVFFAMSHGVHRGVLKKGKSDDRELFINKLIKDNPNFKFNVFGMNQIQPIWGDDFKKHLYNSKIALNLSQGKAQKYYSSDRIAQLMGNGILTFIDKKTKLDHFFNNKEVVFYNSINDLSKKIKFYIHHNKKRTLIAKNGRNKYHKFYNNILVSKYILSKFFNIYKKKKFLWEK